MFATQDSAYEKQVVYILGEGELRMRQAFPLMVKESKLPHGIVDGERVATTNFMDAVSSFGPVQTPFSRSHWGEK